MKVGYSFACDEGILIQIQQAFDTVTGILIQIQTFDAGSGILLQIQALATDPARLIGERDRGPVRETVGR